MEGHLNPAIFSESFMLFYNYSVFKIYEKGIETLFKISIANLDLKCPFLIKNILRIY